MASSDETSFYISHRMADPTTPLAQQHDQLHETWSKTLSAVADSLHQTVSPHGRSAICFKGDPRDIQAKMTEAPALKASSEATSEASPKSSLIVEPKIIYDRQRPIDHHIAQLKQSLAAPTKAALTAPPPPPPTTEAATMTIQAAVVTNSGTPLANAAVTLVTVHNSIPKSMAGTTDAQGQVTFTDIPMGSTIGMLYAQPQSSYWGMVETSFDQQPYTLICPPLPQDGPLGWWHKAVGIDRYDAKAGRGITVGVIDTGCGPNPCLSGVTDAGAIINQQWSPNGLDVGYHGTASCGIIAGLPLKAGDYSGLAVGSSVVSLRVYETDTSGANQMDVALAIDAMASDAQADLINLSLYSALPSAIQHDAIQRALQLGTLCICSAGNNGTAVGYPARFPESVAISGLGQDGCVPPNVVDAIFKPQQPDKLGDDGFYLASFSSWGPQLTATSPAVGIITNVPVTDPTAFSFVSESGTSEAAPIVCSILSRLLSDNPDYQKTPRDSSRSAMALQVLEDYARSVGLQPDLEGHGLPTEPEPAQPKPKVSPQAAASEPAHT